MLSLKIAVLPVNILRRQMLILSVKIYHPPLKSMLCSLFPDWLKKYRKQNKKTEQESQSLSISSFTFIVSFGVCVLCCAGGAVWTDGQGLLFMVGT